MKLLVRLLNLIFPMCPTGMSHRQRYEMVTNVKGNRFCWHRDCIQASFRDVRDDEAER